MKRTTILATCAILAGGTIIATAAVTPTRPEPQDLMDAFYITRATVTCKGVAAQAMVYNMPTRAFQAVTDHRHTVIVLVENGATMRDAGGATRTGRLSCVYDKQAEIAELVWADDKKPPMR